MLDLFFSKPKLIQAINITTKAVPTRTSLPILECLLLEAKNGVITLMANDMEMAICTETGGPIVEEGKVALDAKLFSDIVRKLPDGIVTVSSDEYNAVNIVQAREVLTKEIFEELSAQFRNTGIRIHDALWNYFSHFKTIEGKKDGRYLFIGKPENDNSPW